MDRLRGTLNWDNDSSSFIATTDSGGIFHLCYKCVPTLEPGQVTTWTTTVTPNVDVKMAVQLEPNISQVYNFTGGITSTVVINFAINDDPVEYIHLLFDTGVPASVKMTSWEPSVSSVRFISHTTIAKTSGQNWASSPMYVKPYFFRLGYIQSNLDLQSTLDSGTIIG
jgi:hypothetical protein